MIKTIIPAFPKQKRKARKDGSFILKVSECFTDSIQGEGITAGIASTFLRLQRCTLSCNFCDTTEVWRQGNEYSVEELLGIWEEKGVINSLKEGQHLIITGGSPLLQDNAIVDLLVHFKVNYSFKPFTELENEVVLFPSEPLLKYVDLWNNSPKLSNSEMRKSIRYKPDIIQFMSENTNSIFKFVISKKEDWEEVVSDFLEPNLVKRNQVILMPEGSTREQLRRSYPIVFDLATKYQIRMCDRFQITMFDQAVGV